jgi:DNA-binding XRE family transcriptional regulator
MEKIIVIDTETVTSKYGLLSVGAVVLERYGDKVNQLDTYFGFSNEFEHGFYFAQQKDYAKRHGVKRQSRCAIEAELSDLVCRYGVKTVYAYNAHFDKAVASAYLPSLKCSWCDLMHPARQVLASAEHFAAYKRINPYVELTCSGVLKTGYSVDCVGRYLGLPQETHVAIEDAQMETEIAIRLKLFNYASEC